MIQYLGPVVFPPKGMSADSAVPSPPPTPDTGMRREGGAESQHGERASAERPPVESLSIRDAE